MGTALIHSDAIGIANIGLVVINDDSQWWNTSGTPAFEAYNAANIADYRIAGSESGSTGVYSFTFPAGITVGSYTVLIVVQAGAALAEADFPANGVGRVNWDGSNIIQNASIATSQVLLETTVLTQIEAFTFTLVAGPTVADAHVGALVAVTDADDGHTEVRKITGWSSSRLVLVPDVFSFTPAVGDVVRILSTDYQSLSTHTAVNAAQEVAKLDIDTVEATAAVKSVFSLVAALHKSDTTTNPGFLTLFKSDNSEFARIAIDTNASASPITGMG